MTGEKVRARRERGRWTLDAVGALAGVDPTNLSRFERGVPVLSEEAIERVAQALKILKTTKRHFRGIPIDMRNIHFLRKMQRELGGKATARIPQDFGRGFIFEFCSHARITPAEFAACAQLAPRIVRADILSGPAQRWVRSWAGAIAAVLGDQLFDSYAHNFPDRQAALEDVANKAFARLLAEVGRERILHYMQGLLLTAELRQAPRDVEEN